MPLLKFHKKLPPIKAIQADLPSGLAGNETTIQFMRRVARSRAALPAIRQLALSIIKNVDSHDYVGEAKAIGQFVQKNIRYVKDPTGIEQLTDPLMMLDQLNLNQAQGDCDDMALFIATLLLSIGHEPYFRAVRYDDHFGPYNHIYVVDYPQIQGQGEKRTVLDGIVKRQPIGFEVKHLSGKEYPV